MKKKAKRILLIALPLISILAVCSIRWQFATRFILVVSCMTSAATACIAFLDTYQGSDVEAKACYKLWKYIAAVSEILMIASFVLYIVALFRSEMLVSITTGLVPLLVPKFGARLGIFFKNRRRTP